MNAAFLLVTTAWLAGADPAPTAPPQPAPAPAPLAAPTPGCGSCGGSCGACGSCDEHEGLLAKLRARFHRDSCDTCAPACGAHYNPAPTYSGSGCGCEEGPGFVARLRAKFKREDCGCHGSCGSTCDSGSDGPTLLERLRARFHRDSGCDSCAAPSGCCGAAAPKPPGEPLKMPKEGDAPKKLPDGKDGNDGKESKGASVPKELDLGAPDKAPEGENRRPF